MGKRRKTFVLFFLSFMMCVFCGCSHREPENAPVCTVVTRIELSRQDGITRTYSQSEKMEKILDYLRLADPFGLPDEDPETAEGHSYRIVVYSSDGQERCYWQKSDRYMRVDGGDWQKIKKGQGQQLDELLMTLPGD